MYPMYSYVEDFSLHKDDIEGIQYLYGEVTTGFLEKLKKKKSLSIIKLLSTISVFRRRNRPGSHPSSAQHPHHYPQPRT